MTGTAWLFLSAWFITFALLCLCLWALAYRSIALVEIAKQPWLSGSTLAGLAATALRQTGAKHFLGTDATGSPSSGESK